MSGDNIEHGHAVPVPVCFVDDDADLRRSNAQTLEIAGFAPIPCASATEALRAIDADFPGVVVTDIRMPGMDGMELFRRLQLLDADLPVILITGHGDIATAVQAMREGAYDFLSKPFAAERMVQSIQRAAEKRSLMMENRRLRAEAQQALGESPLLGNAPAMARLKDTLRAVADTGIDVLILGETGTGKEVVAHELHRLSRRASGHFVALNCGALPETVIESELFGHEAGAFTGAQKKRVGLIEYSSGGTLFLDEIESMPAAVQIKLLRVLEAREVTPVGANQPHAVDLRVVAATKVDLADPAQRAHFREDLFHRLNVVTLRIPPLRERGADITLLFTYYVEKAAERFKRAAPPVDAGLRQYLLAHPWPGNVRELRHLAERHVLGLADIGEVAAAPQEQGSLPERVSAYEEKLIRDTLAAHRGDVRLTLQALGIPRKTFYDKLARYGIERVSFEGKDEG